MSDSGQLPGVETKRSTIRRALVPSLFIAFFCVLGFEFFGPLRIARDWVEDLRMATLTPDFPQNEDILVLAITEDTLARFPFRAPIDRAFIRGILQTLEEKGGVRALGIDVLFDQPTTPPADEALRQAILGADFPVVVAVGDEQAGLTARQSAFQAEYLRDMTTGSAVLRSQDGVVRNYWPDSPDHRSATFSKALMESLGGTAPDVTEPILFHRPGSDGLMSIRVFPSHTLNLLPAEWLQGKIVLLGAMLPHQDRHRTPLSMLGGEYESTPGVLIHAQVLAQLLSAQGPPQVSPWMVLMMVLLAVVSGLLIPMAPLTVRKRLLLAIGLVPLYWVAVFNTPVYWNLSVPILVPVAVYILTAAYTLALDRRRQRRQKLFLHDALIHYVAEPVVNDLLAHPENLRLGGEKREMSFLFTDVANFAALAETLPPEQLVGLMTSYLKGLIEVTQKRGGTIGRLTGDGLLVFFGAPVEQRDHARRAVDSAFDIDRYCVEFRARQAQQNVEFGLTRIGVHTGPAVVGNVGGERRFEYTAYGDAINTASRLESLSQHLGTRVCLSADSIVDHPADLFRPVGRFNLKGKNRALDVFTIWDTLSEQDQEACRSAFVQMQQPGSASEPVLVALSERLPEDALTAFQLARLRAGESPVNIHMKEK
jgi:adenylate cyclase